jgi:hypothetical protein
MHSYEFLLQLTIHPVAHYLPCANNDLKNDDSHSHRVESVIVGVPPSEDWIARKVIWS